MVALAGPLILPLSLCVASPATLNEWRFESANAVSVIYCEEFRDSNETFVKGPVFYAPKVTAASALGWVSLGSRALPNMRPLTVQERSSANEFFWSQFS